MKKFNPDMCQELRSKLTTAVAALEKEMGIKIMIGKMTFDAHSVNFKCDARLKDAPSEYMASLLAHLDILSLTEEHLSKQFSLDGGQYVLTGFKPRARSRNMVVQNVKTKKEYVTSIEVVHNALGIKPKF